MSASPNPPVHATPYSVVCAMPDRNGTPQGFRAVVRSYADPARAISDAAELHERWISLFRAAKLESSDRAKRYRWYVVGPDGVELNGC